MYYAGLNIVRVANAIILNAHGPRRPTWNETGTLAPYKPGLGHEQGQCTEMCGCFIFQTLPSKWMGLFLAASSTNSQARPQVSQTSDGGDDVDFVVVDCGHRGEGNVVTLGRATLPSTAFRCSDLAGNNH
eukprot:3846154-Amphidinium_carterae.1